MAVEFLVCEVGWWHKEEIFGEFNTPRVDRQETYSTSLV